MEQISDIGNFKYTDVVCFEPGIASRDGGHIYMNVSGTLRSNPGDNAMTVVCLEGIGIRPSHKGDGYSVSEVMYTLNSTEVHCVCYSIGAFNSLGWLSDNPKAGCQETDVARTVDGNCNPACYQGGVAVVEIHTTRASSERFKAANRRR